MATDTAADGEKNVCLLSIRCAHSADYVAWGDN